MSNQQLNEQVQQTQEFVREEKIKFYETELHNVAIRISNKKKQIRHKLLDIDEEKDSAAGTEELLVLAADLHYLVAVARETNKELERLKQQG